MRAADYVEETTTSIAGTVGDGAITLTAITSVPRFSTVFGTTQRFVRYVIEDTVNMKMEQGIGSVASNVLTRTKPQVTWDGTTWKDGNSGAVTALQFGASPTSGNVKIRMAATAESKGVNIEARQNTVAGDTNWRDYALSGFISWGSNGAGNTLTANREYYNAYKLETPGLLSGIQLEIMTAVAASSIALALYDIGSNGLAGSKIVDFNGFTTTSTGIKTDTTTGTWSPAGGIWLTPGWYVIGFIPSHAIGIRCSAGNNCATPYGRMNAYGWGDVVYAAGSGTTMPANPSPTGMLDPAGNSGARPWIGLRVVA